MHMGRRKKRDLYYMMPGTRSGARRRFWLNMVLCLFVAAVVCALMVWVFSYFTNR